MYLYLIRHGIAVDLDSTDPNSPPDDESRPLTKLGRKKMAQVADRLHESGLKFDLVMTSPLVRARQTAEILLAARLGTELELSSDLAPAGNFPTWIDRWNARSRDLEISKLALVGHEPNLSAWAELAIFGQIVDRFILKKGGIIGLKFTADRIAIGTAQLYCSLTPKYLVSNE